MCNGIWDLLGVIKPQEQRVSVIEFLELHVKLPQLQDHWFGNHAPYSSFLRDELIFLKEVVGNNITIRKEVGGWSSSVIGL